MEHEVIREALYITLDLLVEASCFHSVQASQVAVKDDLLTTDGDDETFYFLHRLNSGFPYSCYVVQPVSATALLRFLSDDCGIELATEPKPIANVLAKMLKADKDKDTFYNVCEYF